MEKSLNKLYEFTGVIGLLCVQGSYIPQLIKTYLTRDVTGLSIWFFGILTIGLLNYLIYSIYIKQRLYIIANFISVIFTGSLLIMILLYR